MVKTKIIDAGCNNSLMEFASFNLPALRIINHVDTQSEYLLLDLNCSNQSFSSKRFAPKAL